MMFKFILLGLTWSQSLSYMSEFWKLGIDLPKPLFKYSDSSQKPYVKFDRLCDIATQFDRLRDIAQSDIDVDIDV